MHPLTSVPGVNVSTRGGTGGGGGGTGTVTSVSAGPGISITGTPTVAPIVNNLNPTVQTTGAGFVQPTVGATVLAPVTTTADFVAGQFVPVAGGGGYELVSIPDATHLVLRNLGGDTNAPPDTVIGPGAVVSRGAMPEQLVYGIPGAPALAALWNVNALRFSVDAAGPTIDQEVTGSALGTPLSLIGQGSIAPNYSPAPVVVEIPARAGTGATSGGYFRVTYGDPGIMIMGAGPDGAFGPSWTDFWLFGADSGFVPTPGNAMFRIDPTGNVLANSGSTFFGGGSWTFTYGQDFHNQVIFTNLGVRFFTGALAAGDGVIGIGDATTPAIQTNLGGSGGILESVNRALHWLSRPSTAGLGAPAFDTTLGPAANDLPVTQLMLNPKFLKVGNTLSAGTVVLVVTPPVSGFGASGDLDVRILGRVAAAGAAGLIGDCVKFRLVTTYRAVGGVVTIGTVTPLVPTDVIGLALVGATATVTAAGATYLVTVTAPANAGSNVDWTILVDELTN